MKVVYIAHPISGDVIDNLNKVLDIVKELRFDRKDIIPLAPYLISCVLLDDSIPEHRSAGIDYNRRILESGIVDELWLYGDRISNGMKEEIRFVNNLYYKVPIRAKTPETKKELDTIILWKKENL